MANGFGNPAGLGFQLLASSAQQPFEQARRGLQLQDAAQGAAAVFRSFGTPESTELATLIEGNPRQAAAIAQSFGGFGNLMRAIEARDVRRQQLQLSAQARQALALFTAGQIDAGQAIAAGVPAEALTNIARAQQPERVAVADVGLQEFPAAIPGPGAAAIPPEGRTLLRARRDPMELAEERALVELSEGPAQGDRGLALAVLEGRGGVDPITDLAFRGGDMVRREAAEDAAVLTGAVNLRDVADQLEFTGEGGITAPARLRLTRLGIPSDVTRLEAAYDSQRRLVLEQFARSQSGAAIPAEEFERFSRSLPTFAELRALKSDARDERFGAFFGFYRNRAATRVGSDLRGEAQRRFDQRTRRGEGAPSLSPVATAPAAQPAAPAAPRPRLQPGTLTPQNAARAQEAFRQQTGRAPDLTNEADLDALQAIIEGFSQ